VLLQELRKPTNISILEGLKAETSDDPIDLLLCGTDVMGSCQRIDGNPELNKGLLGYIVDGKNRLLVIKDVHGKIISRCILRLLWDGEQAVLFRDRIYGVRNTLKYFNRLAMQIANELKVPLTSCEPGLYYPRPLQALGGPSPYEYCDAAFGVNKEGRYNISKVSYVKASEEIDDNSN
jgi:hypothetical protein